MFVVVFTLFSIGFYAAPAPALAIANLDDEDNEISDSLDPGDHTRIAPLTDDVDEDNEFQDIEPTNEPITPIMNDDNEDLEKEPRSMIDADDIDENEDDDNGNVVTWIIAGGLGVLALGALAFFLVRKK